MAKPEYPIPELFGSDAGWGPCTVPEHLKDVPFAPFGKGERLGKASDWTQAAYQKFSGEPPICISTEAVAL